LDAEALSFGARTLLLSTFVVALGAPVFYAQSLADSPALGVAYALGGSVLPVFSALLMWRVQWGPISVRNARRLMRGSFLGAIPALMLALWMVSVGQGRALVGVAVMSFIAALLFIVVARRQRDCPMCAATAVITIIAVVATPAIILSMTQMLPHGLSVITGWAIPIPVAAMGAIGAAYSLKGCARAQAQEA
jgi:hypothetical protein